MLLLVSTTSKGCPYSRKVSPRGPAVILTIGAFRIGDSNLEIATSSAHTADDSPSSYIGLPILELPSDTPLTTNMNLEDYLLTVIWFIMAISAFTCELAVIVGITKFFNPFFMAQNMFGLHSKHLEHISGKGDKSHRPVYVSSDSHTLFQDFICFMIILLIFMLQAMSCQLRNWSQVDVLYKPAMNLMGNIA